MKDKKIQIRNSTVDFLAFTREQTAAEVIVSRANHEKQNMGLTTWKNAPDGKIVKADVSIAKNEFDFSILDVIL